MGLFEGITPACAGNRSPTRWTGLPGRDHPRVCGEQKKCALFASMFSGSPPRVRGTGAGGEKMKLYERITPACAGNSIR